ncbi:MAG TPA: hypothetical protein VIP11_15385 [Gemmatimonadaceae bacterium]
MQLWQVYRHVVVRIPEQEKLALRRLAPRYFERVQTMNDPNRVHRVARDMVTSRFPGIEPFTAMDHILYLVAYVAMHIDASSGELDGVVARDQVSEDKDARSEINQLDSMMLRGLAPQPTPLAEALNGVLCAFGQTTSGLLREGQLPFA